MDHFRRFGRRIPVPSTLQISHELRALSAKENSRTRCSEVDGLPGTSPEKKTSDAEVRLPSSAIDGRGERGNLTRDG